MTAEQYNAILALKGVKSMEKKTSDAQIKSVAKYNKACTVQYSFRLNLKTDAELIDHLSTVPNFAGYIKQLIRADIEKDNG